MNDRRIGESDEDGFGRRCSALTRQQALAKISFRMRKKNQPSWPKIYKTSKPFWLEISKYHESGSTISSSEQVAARSDCRRLGNALCWCSPVRPAEAVQGRGPKSPAIMSHWLCSQNFSSQLSSGIAFGSDCHITCRGSILDSNLNSAAWPTSFKGFICSKSLNELCGVWILLGLLKMQKSRTEIHD